MAFVLMGCIVINRDPQRAVGGGYGASRVGFDLAVISGGGLRRTLGVGWYYVLARVQACDFE